MSCNGPSSSVKLTPSLLMTDWLKRESGGSSPHQGLSTLTDREVELIEAALAESHRRISEPSGTAAKLGIPRQTLESKIRRLGIDKYAKKPLQLEIAAPASSFLRPIHLAAAKNRISEPGTPLPDTITNLAWKSPVRIVG